MSELIVEVPARAALEDPRRSVDRAFRLLEAFEQSETLGVTELARRTGLPKSTTHRLLIMLQERNVVERDGTQYRLGLRLFELGNRVSFGARDVRDCALPLMCDLLEATHQTVHLTVLDEQGVVCLMALPGRGDDRRPTRVGSRIPAHSTAAGKVLLAYAPSSRVATLVSKPLRPYTGRTLVIPQMLIDHLNRIRDEGVAWDREETVNGIECVAAPILDPAGGAIAAISLSGSSLEVQVHAAAVRGAASAITQSWLDRLYSGSVASTRLAGMEPV